MRLNRRGLGTVCSRGRILMAVALLVLAGAVALGLGSGAGQTRAAGGNDAVLRPVFASNPTQSISGPQPIHLAYNHLPLIFELNQGQSDPQVKYLARGSGYGLFLTADEAVLVMQSSVIRRRSSGGKTAVVRMQLAGANAGSVVSGNDPLPGKSNYLIGSDPSKWHRNVPQFARVRYRDVYPGIDLVYYGNKGRLEYDFEVAPAADPAQVALRFQGPDKLKLDAQGNLVLAVNGGDVRLEAPRVYQKIGEQQQPVDGRFVLRGKDQAGFEIGAYDRTRTLVIDPVLTFSTYLGGSGDEACSVIAGTGTATARCPAIAVDSTSGISGPGNVYIAGSTNSIDFPPQPGVLGSLTGAANIFVAKFDPTGSTLVFSTYLGGDGVDTSAGVAVDSALNVYVAGTTSSTNFPFSSNAFQTLPVVAGNHAFASELSPDGTTLLYSTYLAGSGVDAATGLALDFRGKMYVSGTTTSPDFPTTLGAFQTTSKATNQFFFSKLDPVATTGLASLLYSTYIGGSTPSTGLAEGGGIAVDTNNNVYLTGGTDFTDMPVLNAFQLTLKGGTDVWVAKFDPALASGAQLKYLTYLGGSGDDIGNGIAVDLAPNAYVTGSTSSADFPAAGTGVFQAAYGTGASDAFLAKLLKETTTVPLTYFTYLGGTGQDVGLAVAVDSIQGARVTGWTDSTDFPVLNNPITIASGGKDAFAARVDTATTSTAPNNYATLLGGTGDDSGTGVAVDQQGNSYVTGETTSGDFTTASPFQGAINGASDAFVSKLGPVVGLTMDATATPSPVGVGNQVTYKFTITNTADLTSGVTFSDPLPSTGTFVSVATTVGSCSSTPVNGILGCNIGTLNGGQVATVTVILTANTAPTTLTNSATVNVAGSAFFGSASASAVVNDFGISAAPATVTVAAGIAATYTATVSPIPTLSTIPNSITLTCSNVPTLTRCEPNPNTPIPNLNTGPQSRDMVVSTTARPITSRAWQRGGPFYAIWLPVSGLALLGLGMGGKMSRRRRLLVGLFLGGFFTLLLFQAGCGSTSTTPPPTGGTPPGTYTITLTATSGSAARNTTVVLVVQ